MTTLTTPAVAPADPRLAAFCDRQGPEVFGAIVNGNQIWTPDPFDVESIHADARAAFAGLLARAAAPTPPPTGKILLLLGEAGSGKTHLMRAFRNEAHRTATGYCGYMQMGTRVDNYARYVLSNLIDALEQPYQHPNPDTGLSRLARGMLDALDIISTEERDRLCTDLLDADERARLVHQIADLAVQEPRFKPIDIDLIRAVLYLLSNDGRIRPRVLKWLRCEELSPYDRDLIGGLVPRPQAEMALRTIVGLGRLMAATHQAALVLCVDQLEEVIDQLRGEDDKTRWQPLRQAVNTIIEITDALPTAVVVVASLEDLYKQGQQFIPKTRLDRLERDPEPIRLLTRRRTEETVHVIARRLEFLYDALHVDSGPEPVTFPFTPAQLERLAGLSTRDVLDYCRRHREKCIRGGGGVELDVSHGQAKTEQVGGAEKTIKVEQEWNDFLAAFQAPILDDEPALAELLAWATAAVSAEMPAGVHFGADPDGRFVPVEIHRPGNVVDKLLVAVCGRNAQGGGLGRQVTEVVKRAGETPAVIVRSTAFPAGPGTAVAKQLAGLIEPKGRWRRRVVENSDWRAMAAFRAFHQQHGKRPDFADWQRSRRPLAGLPSLNAILALDRITTEPPPVSAPPVTAAAPPVTATAPEPPLVTAAPSPAGDGVLRLGVKRGMGAEPVTFAPLELTQHAAFLGGPGSGKTTAALTLIEQLIMAGVPAVLVDRKGDLCRYADPDAWTTPEPDPDRAARRAALRERIDVAVFTPGHAGGRPLTLPVAPADLGQLPEAERGQVAGFAAAALAGMMGYKSRGTDPKLAILGKAVEVLAATGRPVTAGALKELVEERDEDLLHAVGGYEDKHYKKLAEDLLTLLLQRKHLLDGAAGEPLEVAALVGHGPHARPGKTRLAVVNTQFLGDATAVDFWVAQLLVAIDRWFSKHPARDRLQVVLLFDEADQYLPATRQPATKAPMENLLRRARSKGVGVFLATQSPGDLDYKCRDQVRSWLVGRVKEKVAIDKLRPMLEAGRVDAAAKLPGQAAGQFYLLREKDVVAVQVAPSLVPTAQVAEDQVLSLAKAGLA